MKTKTTLMITMLFLSITLFAQEYTQNVKGKIIDTDSKIPLPGASIVLIGSEPLLGSISDMDGNFKLEKVPVGRQNFEVSYMGYEKILFSEILVSTGREVVLNVEMRESITTLAECTIIATADPGEAINQMATVSATQISVEETQRIAAGINDPGRTAQSFAGVSAADDENNELVIRGNSPRGMLWRMEGIEIPNPNHFSNGEGGSGGGVCALSTQVLANSDFFTGAFPAEYGNALSGIFDLSLRNGNAEKREYALQLGFMGAQAALEGPFKKGSQASYLMNYRYSTLTFLSKAHIISTDEGEVAPEWQDLSFKIYLPTSKIGRFSVWGLGGYSAAGDYAVKDTSQWSYRSDRYEDDETHAIGIAGITHNYLFNDSKTYIKTVASYSYTNNEVTEDSLDYDYEMTVLNNQDITYNTFIINSFVNHKFNARHVLRIGAVYQNKGFDLHVKDLNEDTHMLETQINNDGHTSMAESFVQWQYRINDRIDLNTGLHYTYLALNQDFALEPRFGFKWRIDCKHTLTAGAGLHSRVEAISIYLAEQTLIDGTIVTPNKDLRLTKAVHLVMGHNWDFAHDFRLKTELYYQYLFEVPVVPGDTTHVKSALNFSSGFTNEKLVNEGSGRNYGMEITLEKFFSHNWYMLTTASFFESKYTMPDGIERNTFFNSNYIFNVVGGKEFIVGRDRQNIIGMNLRTIWRGGYRTVPVDLEASQQQYTEVRMYDQAFESKVPDYFRVDIGVSYRKNKPTWAWVLSLDIQNLTDRSNIWDEYYDPEKNAMEQTYMVGLVPVLNYRIEF